MAEPIWPGMVTIYMLTCISKEYMTFLIYLNHVTFRLFDYNDDPVIMDDRVKK